MSDKNIIVRFPPSPTGLFHIGSARTALFNYFFAKKNGGKFLLRTEDTDKERSKKEYEEDIFDSLKWLCIEHDNKNDVWRQSERTDVYKKYLDLLLKSGAAYISQETEGENREVVRFKNPGGKIKFHDLIRGEVETDVSDLKDFIIARNVSEPLYHFVVVVDDMESRVTHVIRGEDGIPNTPRQILIWQALAEASKADFIMPEYAHLPLVLDTDKSKLSKRKRGESVSLRYYRDKGYLPEAIVNFLAFIGWNPGTEQEIFSMDELINLFDLSEVQKKGAIFNIEKLDWINREWVLKQTMEEQFSNLNFQISKSKWNAHPKVQDKEFLEKFLKIMLDRIHRWGEVGEILDAGEFDYLFTEPKLDQEKICWKGQSRDSAKKHLEKVLELLDENEKIMQYANTVGKGDVLWPLRYALSGMQKSPDPITLLNILDVKESIQRINTAIKFLTD